MMQNMTREVEEMEWKTLDTVVLEEDKNLITVAVPNAKEIELWFYGRENDAGDTMTSGNGSDGLRINGITVSNYALAYPRRVGTMLYTHVTAKIACGFLDGTISKKGNNELVGFSSVLANVESIKEIAFATNNLFKSGSKITVFYR